MFPKPQMEWQCFSMMVFPTSVVGGVRVGYHMTARPVISGGGVAFPDARMPRYFSHASFHSADKNPEILTQLLSHQIYSSYRIDPS